MNLSRRGFFFGLAALAAPAVIRTPGLLMPIRALLSAAPEGAINERAMYRWVRGEGGLVLRAKAPAYTSVATLARITAVPKWLPA